MTMKATSHLSISISMDLTSMRICRVMRWVTAITASAPHRMPKSPTTSPVRITAWLTLFSVAMGKKPTAVHSSPRWMATA